jgi:hypothetical protein
VISISFGLSSNTTITTSPRGPNDGPIVTASAETALKRHWNGGAPLRPLLRQGAFALLDSPANRIRSSERMTCIYNASSPGERSLMPHLCPAGQEWTSAPGEYGLLEMGHPGGQAVQRQLAELMDNGGGRSVDMAAEQRQAKDRRGRFRDVQ